MRKFIAALSIMALAATTAGATTFDKWNVYPAYNEITDIEPTGNYVYVLSSGNLFSYNVNDGSVSTYTKVFPLSDCGISRIAWNNSAKKLIILYDNYNIDLLDNKQNVVNVADYYNKTLTQDKTVFNIVINGNIACLCTSFGIVEIDMGDGLVRETYNIGKPIYDCAFKGNDVYAVTTGQVLKGEKSDNLLDPDSWKEVTSYDVSFAHPNDISSTTENGYTELYTYDKTNKVYWSSQKDNKLQAYTNADDGTRVVVKSDINPDGPMYNDIGYMKIQNRKMYTCNGVLWDRNQPAAIQVYDIDNNAWTSYSNEGIGEKYNTRYKDILCLEVDPDDDSHVFAGAQTGIYEFRNGAVVNRFDAYNSNISYVQGAEGNDNYQIVTSLIFDKDKTLWALVSEASGKSVITYSQKEGWKAPERNLSGDIVNGKFMGYDQSGRIWIVSGRYSGRAVYCYSADLANLYTYNTFRNEDGSAISGYESLRGIAEDREGNIWIASNVGVLTLNDEFQRDPSKGFYQIKVPRNDGTNYADYLMANIDLSCVAVDNANRKWIGTLANGVYVISADNMTQEAHLTAANSCLPSDAVNHITIDKLTGRAYIATDKGLCSVESYASETADKMEKDNVWAYPNPVTPDYTGLVTVTGLSYNADVKITTVNGALVAEGRSTGGSFQWDCKDLKGKRVASGVYMVNTATESGESGTVCKIAVIN